jgi:hypothetical protein
MFAGPILYARIRRNRISLRRVDSGQEVELAAEVPFTNSRMLVADFTAAQALMKKAMQQVKGFLRPAVVIHPLELIEGGLSEVEKRILLELALGGGAGRVNVWVGPELGDAEVREQAKK